MARPTLVRDRESTDRVPTSRANCAEARDLSGERRYHPHRVIPSKNTNTGIALVEIYELP